MIAKRLIVHLGLAKTGTTVLQQSFHDNRQQLLEEHGILYPSNGPNHFHFQTAVSDAPEHLIQIRREGIVDREVAKERAQQFLDEFKQEVDRTQPQTILISSEYFASLKPGELAKLAELLSTFAEEVWATAYMRDPWSYSSSLMQQLVRDGRFGAPIRFGYCSGQVEVIQSAEKVFGDKLVVRPYFGGKLFRTDIVSDFCEAIGIGKLQEGEPGDPASNRSIGHIRMTLIAELNRAWPQFDSNGVYKHSSERDAALQDLLDLPLQDRSIILTKRQVDVIQVMAKDDMEYVEARHFGGKPLFSEYMSNEDPPVHDHTISLENLTEADLREVVRAYIERNTRNRPSET